MSKAGLLLLTAAIGCTSPDASETRLLPGILVRGSLGPSEARSLAIEADSGTAYKLFVLVEAGAVDVDITSPSDPAGYPTQHLVVTPGVALADAPHFTLLQLDDATYALTLTAPPDSSARYQLMLYAVSRAPEHRASLIAVEDTIHEPLEFAGDIDEFLLPLDANTNVVIGATAPVGPSAARLHVEAQAADQSILAQFEVAPGNTAGGVPFHLPAAGVVMLRITSEGLHGAYRIWSSAVP